MSITLTPTLLGYVVKRHARGLHGRTIGKVVEGLFLAGLREAMGIGDGT